MVTFLVNDMSCEHCVKTITEAVAVVDRDAKVRIDLSSHRVHIEPALASAGTLRAAIEEAGYTPVGSGAA